MSIAVTLFEDMAEKSRMAHHDFDLIYDKAHREEYVSGVHQLGYTK